MAPNKREKKKKKDKMSKYLAEILGEERGGEKDLMPGVLYHVCVCVTSFSVTTDTKNPSWYKGWERQNKNFVRGNAVFFFTPQLDQKYK